MRLKKHILFAGTIASAWFYSAVSAQTAVAASDIAVPSSDPAGGDIIVTARKRQESILKVPVVETALTQGQLARTNLTDLTKLSSRIPGLVLGNSVLATGTQVSLRGIGTSALDPGIDQSVSLNIDGLQLSQGLAYRAGVFDLAQAEVLKGPQALFFGKSSPGGVISLRTADPGRETEVVVRSTYDFQARGNREEVILSGPLTDTFGIRLAGLYSHDNGYFRNIAVAIPATGAVTPTTTHLPTQNFIGRLTALWQPASSFNARLKVNVTNDKVEGTSAEGQFKSCPDGVNRAPLGINFLGGAENCKIDRNLAFVWMNPAAFPGIRNGGKPFTYSWQEFGTLELNYQPAAGITLTSVTGYYGLQFDALINGVIATAAAPTLAADNHFTRREVTQELRANSDFSGPLNFTAGAFYQNGDVHNRIDVIGDTAYRLPGVLSRGTHHLSIDSISAFGQARYKVDPKLEVAAGVRFTHEKRSDDAVNIPASNIATPIPLANPSIKSSNWSPEFTVTYYPTDNLTVFGSLKQGYKSGSFTITTIPTSGANNSFGDEKVQGGEAGLKGRILDRQVTFNIAGYYYHYKGLQVGANSEAANGVPFLRTINAGAANVYGVDFDFTYRPAGLEQLALRGAANWNHARFKRLDGVPCWGGQTIAQGCNELLNPVTGQYTSQNLSGGRLVRAPTWQVSAGFDYDFDLGNNMKLTLTSDSRYSTRYLVDLLQRSDMYQRGYFMTDATLALHGPSDAWELALIGINLTNKLTTGNCTNLNAEAGQVLGGQRTGTNNVGPAGVDELQCQYNRGREVFLRLTLRPTAIFR